MFYQRLLLIVLLNCVLSLRLCDGVPSNENAAQISSDGHQDAQHCVDQVAVAAPH
jgi:hypothetical protein